MNAPARGDGNQAIAWAALDAGIGFLSHYPGSPVNRVADAVRAAGGPCVIDDALNEHVATLATAGASFAGARAMVVMKHVGMNIAADPLNYIGLAGCRGGMVLAVGTDPGARSSTGEEDVHWYAIQCGLPTYEPTSIQALYDQIRAAFDVSERHRVPVLVLVPGRLAYQSEPVRRAAPLPPRAPSGFAQDRDAFINVGQRAVTNHRKLLERLDALAITADDGQRHGNPDDGLGLITRGQTYRVTLECLDRLGLTNRVDLLNVERVHPLDAASVVAFCAGKREVVVIEDQDGFLEHVIKQRCFNDLHCRIEGKSLFPAWGEVDHARIAAVLAERCGVALPATPDPLAGVPERLGTFCEGCPHRGSFFAIDRATAGLDAVIGGDIGCSSLPPFRNDWLLCMNAGVGISQGICAVSPDQVVISTGGEGSFFHGGITALQSAVENGRELVHVLLDNESIAMTGHQTSPSAAGRADIPAMLAAIGVAHVLEADPFQPSAMTQVIQRALALPGVKVVWARGRCALEPDAAAEERRATRSPRIAAERCGGCTTCHDELACPAIGEVPGDVVDGDVLAIDLDRCARCGACHDICPNGAIDLDQELARARL